MAVTTPQAAAPTGLSPKARRAWEFLGAHEQRMNSASVRGECKECKGLIGKYRPPIGRFEEPCRKCGTYNVLTTEPVTSAS